MLRTCPNGHKFNKTSDCPTCPICEAEKKTTTGFMAGMSAPAQRALAGAGIDSPEKLAQHTEKEVMALHGMGPASLPKLRAALAAERLSFKSVASN